MPKISREELSPVLRETLELIEETFEDRFERRDLARAMGISYGAARYRLERLRRLGFIHREVEEVKPRIYKYWYFRFYEVEYVKYYKYKSAKPYRKRHFEARATFTLPPNLDFERFGEEWVEDAFDDVLAAEIPEIYEFEMGFEKAGGEKVGYANRFKEDVEVVVVDKRPEEYSKAWGGEMSEYIYITEEELEPYVKEEEE